MLKHNNAIILRQLLLVGHIIKTSGFDNAPVHSKPMPSTSNLCEDEDGQEYKES